MKQVAAFHAVFVVVVGGAVLSCGREAVEPGGDLPMHITLAEPAIALLPGSTGIVEVGVVRKDYDGPVILKALELPSGVTAAEVIVAPDEIRGEIILVASTGAVPGLTGVRIRAEGEDIEPSERALQLTIRPTGSFSLSANPILLVPGSSGSTTIEVTRIGGFTGAVELTTLAPAGIAAVTEPAALQGLTASSLLTVTVDRGVRAGAYFVTIRAVSPGLPDEIIDVTVTVVGTGGAG